MDPSVILELTNQVLEKCTEIGIEVLHQRKITKKIINIRGPFTSSDNERVKRMAEEKSWVFSKIGELYRLKSTKDVNARKHLDRAINTLRDKELKLGEAIQEIVDGIDSSKYGVSEFGNRH